MKRPVSLTIVAIVLFVMGTLGLLSDALTSGRLAMHRLIFALVYAYLANGLLNFQRSSRRVAMFIFAGLIPFSIWGCLHPDRMEMGFPGGGVPSVFVAVTMFASSAMLSAWALWVLLRRDVRELFQPRTIQRFNDSTI